MTHEHREKQLHQIYAYTSIPKSIDDQNQERFSNNNGLSKLRKFQSVWVTFLLLAFIAFTYTLGICFSPSPSVHFFKCFTHKHILKLKTIVPSPGTSSIHVLCKAPSQESQGSICHDNEAIMGTLRHPSVNGRSHWTELTKRTASNGSGIMEELPTAPPNIPLALTTTTPAGSPNNAPFTITTTVPANTFLTVTTTATIPPVVIGATSKTLVPPILSTPSVSTPDTPDSSTMPSNPAAKTLTSQRTSSQLPETTLSTVETPELTTLTGTSQDDDLPSSTTKASKSPSSVWTTITKETIYTTTLPDGAFSTFTSTTVIEADAKQTNTEGPSKTKPSAGLQTNAAKEMKSLSIEKAMGIFGLMMVGAL